MFAKAPAVPVSVTGQEPPRANGVADEICRAYECEERHSPIVAQMDRIRRIRPHSMKNLMLILGTPAVYPREPVQAIDRRAPANGPFRNRALRARELPRLPGTV
jgi:hypothetical protein